MPDSMTPDEIRDIRKALDLTQAEAGIVIGGGPRAFAKYEAGHIQPSASLVKLLRLLDRHPSAIEALGGEHRRQKPPLSDAPFTCSGEDVMRLREWQAPEFLRSLLHAEAEANGLPVDDIHVAERFSVPDGGEDAHIRWQDGRPRTPHLPARYIQFQIKTGAITPAKAAKEVLANDGGLKEMVRTALEAGSHYVLLCTTSLTAKKKDAITRRVADKIREVGFRVASERIHVWDADQVAAWTNRYPPLVAHLKERSQSQSTGPFRSWGQWAGQSEHVLSPLVEDTRLATLRTRAVTEVGEPGSFLRVVGASGIGKSRLVLESLDATAHAGFRMRDFVLYADQSEVEETAIFATVRTLAEHGARAIVVVDDCSQRTHERLVSMVTGPGSRLSLITIDNNDAYSPSAGEGSTARVDLAPRTVAEGIIDRLLPGLASEDRRRLVLFSEGFPTIAVRVAHSWTARTPVAHSTDKDFVRAFVCGRNEPAPETVMRTAMLIAAFGTARHTADQSETTDLAKWGHRLTPADMHMSIERLLDRGVVQRRGGLLVLQPRPVAMWLTERQWREWTSDQWSELLAGDMDLRLKANAARQLEWINDTDIAMQVAKFLLQPNGALEHHGLRRSDNSSVLYRLAAIDAQGTVNCLRRCLDAMSDLRTVEHKPRRDLVEAIARIAFREDTFDEAARLMLRLAVAETEDGFSNNATGQFAGLFPLVGGATEADGSQRLAILREAASSSGSEQRAVVAKALLAGASTTGSWRMVGAETHGSRPALEPWRPPTSGDAAEYVTACVELLADAAMVQDTVGYETKAELGRELRRLVSWGLTAVVEETVHRVQDTVGGWPEAAESLGHFLQFDAAGAAPETSERVRRLIASLEPATLSERILNLVSHMPFDYPLGEDLDYQERGRRQLETVHAIAAEALHHPSVLAARLPELCSGSQRWTGFFGEFLGARIDSPEEWLRRIVTALRDAPDVERNFDLLAGFLTGLSERDCSAVERFKREVSESKSLARALPAICARLGLVDGDVSLAISALRDGRLPPRSLETWALGSVLCNLSTDRLASLFDELYQHGFQGLATTVDLVAMWAHADHQRLEGLRPQLIQLASRIAQTDVPRQSGNMAYHASTLLRWLLKQGRHDEDACRLALVASQGLTQEGARGRSFDLLSPLLPDLLSGFPDIAWPIIGQRILGRTTAAFVLRTALASHFSRHTEDSPPPIESLPPDTLIAWCSAFPDEAPACAVGIVPVLARDRDESKESALHPTFRRLLDQFGDREDVLEAARSHFHTFSWSGSLTTYFAQYLAPLVSLHDHPIPRVTRWAKRMCRQLEREIEKESARDAEEQALWQI